MRNPFSTIFFAASVAVAATPLTASASTVFDQPSDGTACAGACWTSSTTDGTNGFRAFDNFTLANAATINRVTWRGFYLDFVNAANNPPTPGTNSWTIGFFANAGGTPGAQLFSQNFTTAQVARTLIGPSSFGNTSVNLYEFTLNLTSGFAAAAGTTYWFSPLSNQTSFNPIFSWSSSNTGDGTTWQTQNSGTPVARAGNRAFSLGAVPEPASWAMMIAGFGLIGFAMRRDNVRRLRISYS